MYRFAIQVFAYDIINRPRQNGRHFADDMFKCIFLTENVWIPIEISLTFVPKGSISNNPALFQIMAWRRPGDKPLCEPMMVSSLTHICVTRPQWVKSYYSVCIGSKCYTLWNSENVQQGKICRNWSSLWPCDDMWCLRSWLTHVHVSK